MNWINVKDGLPDDTKEVLLFIKTSHFETMVVAQWCKHFHFWNSEIDIPYDFVTHWMPIPEPPKD